MNKLAIAFLAAASLASFGCKKKGGDTAAFEKHVDAVCACKDKECLDKENADYAKANPPSGDTAAKPSEEPSPKMKELGQKLGDCTGKIMTAGAQGAMGGAGAAGGAAAGGTPPAEPAPGGAAAGGTPPAGGAAEPPAAGGTPPAGGAAEPAAGSGSAAK